MCGLSFSMYKSIVRDIDCFSFIKISACDKTTSIKYYYIIRHIAIITKHVQPTETHPKNILHCCYRHVRLKDFTKSSSLQTRTWDLEGIFVLFASIFMSRNTSYYCVQ